MTAKERLRQRAAGLKTDNQPQGTPLQMPSLKRAEDRKAEQIALAEQEAAAQKEAQRQKVLGARTAGLSGPREPVQKTPVSDRAKKVAEIRAGIDTTPIQSRAGKAGQSIGLNTMASVQYLGETVGQIGENTRDWLGTDEAEEYAAAVSEFNRIRKYALEDSPEYIAAEQRMLQARQKAEAKSAEEQSETVDPDSRGSRMMRESIRLQEEALEGTTGVTRFLGETGMSVASNLAKLPLGAAAPVLMGAEAAAGKAYELQQQGVGAGQAMTRGITSGVIEGITEKMGLDNLFDLVKTGGKTAVKNVLKQAGVEGTEEGFSYVFNLLADKVAKDPNAKFDWQELLQSIASGAISGLFFGAAGTAVNRGQALPGVIEQTGKEKQAPRDGSLHLASDRIAGLPNAETALPDTENVLELPTRKTAEQLQQEVENLERRLAEQETRTREASGDQRTVEEVVTERLRERLEEARAEHLDALSREGEAQSLPMVEERKDTADQIPTELYNERFGTKKVDVSSANTNQTSLVEDGLSGTSKYTVAQTEPTVKPDPVEPTGLPMKRREEIQDALTAGLNGGRTLGDNEARTGLPLPTEVESQLKALEALTTPMEDGDDVANTIRKYMGEEAALYWLEHKNDDAEGAEDGDLFSRPTPDNSGAATDEAGDVVGTHATEKLGVRIEGGIADMSAVQAARQAQWGLDVAQKQIEKFEKALHASAAEKRMAESIAKGQDTLDSFKYGWDGKDNRRRSVVEELSALYRMRDLYDRKGIKALGRKNKDVFIDKLNAEILNHVQDATPPKAASLHTNTWSRNNLRTWGRELGEKVNQLIFDPIRRNEANRIRWLDSQATDMKILGELTDAENEAVFDMLDNGKEVAAYDGVRNDVVQEAADKLKTKYAQYYDAINDVLVAHGYPEIGFIKNYAPHKQPEQMKSAMSIFEKLGLSDTVTELPTELAGRTDVFKPGKKWNPHFLHRTGDKAALDAVGGYMSYLNYMSEVLFHVDDIQKVRTFGDQIRYLYGDEGLQADYDAIRADTTLNEQEKELELARIRERQTDNSKMGAYVTALDNYANILAGKQTQRDRSTEHTIGREGLNWIQKPIKILVQSSIPGNLSSAINQTVQLPWLTAEAGEGNVLQAAWELSRGKLKREGFAGESDFITGKRGAENYNKLKTKTAGEKVLDAASIPFEVVDDASSQIIVRAFYLKNVKAGMEHEDALRQADKQAERLVGSRMKGQKANIFSDKELKLLTTFQLEVANQWQHLKFDLPQEYRDIERTRGAGAAKAEAVKRIVKGTVYTAALNALIEQITGSKPAGYDIIGTIWDYIKAGLPGEEEEDGKFDPIAGLADLGKAVVDDLPFVGNLGAMVGIGDGRLPLPSLDVENLWGGAKKRWTAETDEEKAAGWKQIGAGALKSVATLVPMGNQIRKTIEGGETAIRGGRYTNDGTQLMYEVESSPQNIARGLLFGRNALPETREYWDEGGKAVLSQKQTGLMEKAGEYGVDQGTFVDFIQQAKKLAADKDAEGKTIDGSLERKKISLLDGMDLSGEQKLQLYLDNVASDSRKEDVEAMTAAGMNWDQMAPAIDTYLSMEAEDLGATQKATQLASWADQNLNGQQAAVVKERLEYWQMMRAEASSYEKLTGAGLSSESAQRVYDLWQSLEPEAGKTTVTETQKQKAVANSREISEGDKRMAVRSMLDGTALEKFDTCVRAGVNTADYVRVKEFNSNTYADKDKNGKSISGSKKEKVWKYINGLAVSESGKDALSVLCGYDTKLNEAPWHNGIVGLPMLEQAGNAEQFTMPVLELPSRERSGWEMPALMLP